MWVFWLWCLKYYLTNQLCITLWSQLMFCDRILKQLCACVLRFSAFHHLNSLFGGTVFKILESWPTSSRQRRDMGWGCRKGSNCNFIFTLMEFVASYFSVSWQSESFAWVFSVRSSVSGESLFRSPGTNRRTANCDSQIPHTKTCSPCIGKYIHVWHDPIW